ncbi:unnamed protein product [Timema podura]|uniref:Uncharacterized protein n=1 Tax=Timema podura TaxID=61482 RepID=A0ABN7NUW7_TIMPD|nr:unnamed protein product [Timema podura]
MARTADDEQSDWFGGDSSGRGGWWEEGDGGDSSRPHSALAMEDTDSEEIGDPAFKAILAGSFEHLSEEAKQAYRAHMMWVREGLRDTAGAPYYECEYNLRVLPT